MQATERRPLFVEASDQRIAFAAIVLTVGVVRAVVFAIGGGPATVDAGNWIAFGDDLLGADQRSSSLAYPPLIPIVTTLATRWFGVVVGVALVGAVASVLPAISTFWALGAMGVTRLRVVAAAIPLGAGSVGEMAAWGGFPQLVGLALVPVVGVAVDRVLRRGRRADVLLAGAAMAVLAAASHLVLPLGVAVAAGTVVARRGWRDWRHLLAATATAIVLSAPLVPTYLDLVAAVFGDPNPATSLDDLTWSNLRGRVEHLISDVPLLWRLMTILALVGPVLRWHHAPRDLVVFSRVLVGASVLLTFATREGRYLYVLPVVVGFGFAIWVTEIAGRVASPQRRRGAAAGAIVLALVVIGGGVRVADEQRAFYAVLTPEFVDAVDVAAETTETGVIAVPSIGNAPVGWWVEALTDEQVLYGSPLRWLNFDDEVRRAEVANEIFAPGFPLPSSVERIDTAGVDVLVIPKRWQFYDERELLAWIDEYGLRLVDFNGDALVIAR